MTRKLKIQIDCKHYLGYKPCKFHKQDGRLCENCQDYLKIENKILIIKLGALGDVLRTASILPALGKKYPNSHITWITKNNASILLKNNPNVHRILEVEKNYLEIIIHEKFDIGICLDSELLSSTILSLADCTKKFGFKANNFGHVIPANKEAEEWYLMGINDHLKKENRKTYHEIISEICKLDSVVKKPQLILDEDSKTFAKQFFKKNHLNKSNKIIGINTGGGKRWQLKKWTLENYIESIKILKNSFTEIGILLFGGPEEVKFNQMIIKEVGSLLVDTGCHNSVLQFSALIDLVDVFFTPDSLGMHLSIALEKITIVLVGPTSPWELDVFERGEIVYNKNLNCIACYKPFCDKKINCMNSIQTEEILKIIEKYL